MGKNQHVTPHPDGGWQVKGEGNHHATVRTTTQKEAIDRGREISRNQSQLFIALMVKLGKKIRMDMTHFRQEADK